MKARFALVFALVSTLAAEGRAQTPVKPCIPVVSTATGVAITSCQDVSASNPMPTQETLPRVDTSVSAVLVGPGTVVLDTRGAGTATFTLTGTFTGLSATIQGLTLGAGPGGWVNLPIWINSGTNSPGAQFPGTGIFGAGTWSLPVAGFAQVRLNVTALSTGSLNVFGEAGAGAFAGMGSVSIISANGGVFAGVVAPADSAAANTGLAVTSQGELFNGTTWDRSRSLGVGTGIAGVDLAPSANAAIGITPVASTSAVASQVLKASGGNFYSASAVNATATAGFCLVINATSAPTTGSAVTPLEFAVLPASGSCSIVASPPDVFSTGITFLVSSNASPFTFTSGTITAAISGRVQ